MNTAKNIQASERHNLTALFAKHEHLRPSIDAILQGHCGDAFADDEKNPQVAMLTVNPCVFFAGDPSHPVATEMLDELSGYRLVLLTDGAWRDIVFRTHPDQTKAQQWTAFSWESLEPQRLQQLVSCTPEGIRIERIDVNLAKRIPTEVCPHLIMSDMFESPDDFVEHSFGFCAITDEDHIVSAATGAIMSQDAIEIQINTNVSHRRLGLATAVGAALACHCLEHGIEPHWDTTNDLSGELARRIGYIESGTYEVVEVSME